MAVVAPQGSIVVVGIRKKRAFLCNTDGVHEIPVHEIQNEKK